MLKKQLVDDFKQKFTDINIHGLKIRFSNQFNDDKQLAWQNVLFFFKYHIAIWLCFRGNR